MSRFSALCQTFDQDAWKRLIRTLAKRARLVPPNSLTARCLALERFAELRRLHGRAVRTETPRPWHTLRIGLKRFRYTLESFLPTLYVNWEEGLRQMQGLLGEIHDLDVFKTWINEESDVAPNSIGTLLIAVETERKACIEQYRQHTNGEANLLQVWKTGLMQDTAIAAATAARLRTTARTMDPQPKRTAEISRLALRIFDNLGIFGIEPRFRDVKLRVVLRTAAQLHGIHNGDGHTSPQRWHATFCGQ